MLCACFSDDHDTIELVVNDTNTVERRWDDWASDGIIDISPAEGDDLDDIHCELTQVYSAAVRMRFIELNALRTHGSLPRFGSNQLFKHSETGERNQNLCRDVTTFRRSATCFVFISHRWLRPKVNHPDNTEKEKFNLIVQGCDALVKTVVPDDFKVALWIDYCCIDQDNVPTTELLNLDSTIAACDLLLTPVVDKSFSSWSVPDRWDNCFEQYQAEEWHVYWTRAWCRIEAMLAATIPLNQDISVTPGRYSIRAELFNQGPLREALQLGRRPHVIFGTKEFMERTGLLFLPPLLHEHLELYAPLKGTLTNDKDLDIIQRITNKCQQHVESMGKAYIGDVNEEGQPNGRGKKFWPNGKVYDGEFVEGKQHGVGKCSYAHWDTYEGEWKDDQRHGIGKHLYANGNVYEGEWQYGKKHGVGRFQYANGTVYEGQYHNGVEVDGTGGVARPPRSSVMSANLDANDLYASDTSSRGPAWTGSVRWATGSTEVIRDAKRKLSRKLSTITS